MANIIPIGHTWTDDVINSTAYGILQSLDAISSKRSPPPHSSSSAPTKVSHTPNSSYNSGDADPAIIGLVLLNRLMYELQNGKTTRDNIKIKNNQKNNGNLVSNKPQGKDPQRKTKHQRDNDKDVTEEAISHHSDGSYMHNDSNYIDNKAIVEEVDGEPDESSSISMNTNTNTNTSTHCITPCTTSDTPSSPHDSGVCPNKMTTSMGETILGQDMESESSEGGDTSIEDGYNDDDHDGDTYRQDANVEESGVSTFDNGGGSRDGDDILTNDSNNDNSNNDNDHGRLLKSTAMKRILGDMTTILDIQDRLNQHEMSTKLALGEDDISLYKGNAINDKATTPSKSSLSTPLSSSSSTTSSSPSLPRSTSQTLHWWKSVDLSHLHRTQAFTNLSPTDQCRVQPDNQGNIIPPVVPPNAKVTFVINVFLFIVFFIVFLLCLRI